MLLFSSPPNHVQLFATPWTAAHQSSLTFTDSWSLPKFMFTALVMLSSYLILWHLLLLLPSTFPSIRDFSSESSVHIRWPKYWSFSFSISPSSEYSGLISFRVDLLAVQGTCRCLLQHRSLKASFSGILQSNSHNRTWPLGGFVVLTRAMALTIWTFVSRVSVSAFQHSILVCHHFPVKKQSSSDYMAAVTICSDFGAKEEEICHHFHLCPLYMLWGNGD